MTPLFIWWISEKGQSLPRKVLIKEIKGTKKKEIQTRALDRDESIWLPLPDLEKKLIYLQHNGRPDCLSAESAIYLALSGGKEKIRVSQGERVYLQCIDEENLSFSKEKSPFWIETELDPSGKLDVLFKVEYPGVEDRKFLLEEKGVASTALLETGSMGEMRRFLNGGKVYLPDLLRSRYGGAEFSKTSGLHRLELKGEALFLKAGDLFVWKGGKFLKGEKETRGLPLLYVKSIEQGQCHCFLWDEEGFNSCKTEFPIVQPEQPISKMQSILVRLHQRTDSSVTCMLQNRNQILKEGDWLLSSKQGWHNLHSAKELKEYLRYALKGELFIFDGIVKKDSGTFFTGHLFDETRALCQKVELPLKVEAAVKKISSPIPNGKEMKRSSIKGKLKNAVGCNDVLLDEEEGDS
jgi:hypothetical protein